MTKDNKAPPPKPQPKPVNEGFGKSLPATDHKIRGSSDYIRDSAPPPPPKKQG